MILPSDDPVSFTTTPDTGTTMDRKSLEASDVKPSATSVNGLMPEDETLPQGLPERNFCDHS